MRRLLRHVVLVLCVLSAWGAPALAGPPYVTDDPKPTDFTHYEIYLFAGGTATRGNGSISGGIDFNYGAAPDLQLTAVLPLAVDNPAGGRTAMNLGNVELAAKYRFLHQDDFGWNVAIFPRIFLPAGSSAVGERHAALLLPVWIGRDWDDWSTFGGGGCELNRGGDSQNFCTISWALTRNLAPGLQIGAEIYHQTADTRGGRASTSIGAGLIYDISDHYHLMASLGPGIQNADLTNRYSCYSAFLVTY